MTAVAHDHQGNKPGVGRTLASSRRSRGLATLPTPSGADRLSLYRSATRSRST
jgi:hypothetical protein